MISCWLHLGPDDSVVGGRPVHCGMLSSTPGLHPLDASSALTPGGCNNQKCLQTFPSVLQRQNHPQLRTTVLDVASHSPNQYKAVFIERIPRRVIYAFPLKLSISLTLNLPSRCSARNAVNRIMTHVEAQKSLTLS